MESWRSNANVTLFGAALRRSIDVIGGPRPALLLDEAKVHV
jgi:hypothetical protein